MKVTIYGLHCPLAGYVKYVGKAVNVLYRFNRHLGPKELLKDETHKTRWIRKLLSLGLSPELVILEETDEEHWAERERWWIEHLRTQGFILTNSTDGGEGVAFGSKRPPEHCKKISQGMLGRKVSAETRAKISAAHTGKKLPKERVEKQTRLARERASKMTPEERAEMASHFAGHDEKRRKNQIEARRPGLIIWKQRASKYRGVTYNSRPGRRKRWTASIPKCPQTGGKKINLGYFMMEEEAALAYNMAAAKYLGPNIPLNVIAAPVN